MVDPGSDVSSPQMTEAAEILRTVTRDAIDYLDGLEKRPVRSDTADEAAESFGGSLAETGVGGMQAVQELLTTGVEGAVHSAGPRFFHFVVGGSTPAALGADWIASMLDQDNGAWVATPVATRLEVVALGWLKDLFGLPQSWGGVLTTGATMANFTGLACARRWWGLRHDVDVDDDGFARLPAVPIFSSGYVHPSATKALAMLGMGRGRVRRLARDDAGRLDVDGLAHELSSLKGAPAIVIGNAGEVNAGDFDPIADMADLCEKHGAWLHVDGAFGLFARISPSTAHLAEGVERAHSVISDGHKWLNVPYDCGFAFVHDPALLPPVFRLAASYLPDMDEERPTLFNFGPESSRRARSFTVWATLRAYGRSGYRAMVERHVELARRIAASVDQAPDLELLAPAQLNIVCFRYRPEGWSDETELDALNGRIADEVLTDGRVYVGSTVYEGRVAFRPAIVNWLTKEDDVDLLVEVIREIGARLTDA
jgi:glutamate/tyrosine decarboxylase-like PLP-dependent enzyme